MSGSSQPAGFGDGARSVPSNPRLLMQRGFTLLELVVAITVLGTLAAVGSQILASGVQAFEASQAAVTTLSKAQYASERLARELRGVTYSGGSYAITFPSTTQITFTRSDGTSTDTVDLRFIAPNLTLTYGSVVGTYVLSDQVVAATFTGYRSDGVTQTTNAALIAYVDLQMTWSDGGTQYPRRIRVALREQPW